MSDDDGPRAAQLDLESQLNVVMVAARGLRNADAGPLGLGSDKSDPYCICEVPGKRDYSIKTRVIDNTLDPVWNHEGVMHNWERGDPLTFNVYDKDFGKRDDFLGTLTLLSSEFDRHGFDGERLLIDAGEGIRAYIHIRISFGKPMWNQDNVQQAAMANASFTETAVTSMKTRRRNMRLGIDNTSVGTTRAQFRDFIRAEKDRTTYCSTLPFTIAVWLTFSLVCYLHGNVQSVHRLQTGIRTAVDGIRVPTTLPDGTNGTHITLQSITSAEDMWHWTTYGLVPRLSGRSSRPGYLQDFNKVVGSLQLRQRRVETEDCAYVGEDLQSYVGMLCRTDVPMIDAFLPSPQPVPNPSAPASAVADANGTGIRPVGEDPSFLAGGGMLDLPLGASDRYYAFLNVEEPDEGKSRALALWKAPWCDKHTEWVEMHATLFNGEVGAFTHVEIRFEFLPSGLVQKDLYVQPLHIPRWTTVLMMLDIFWMLLILILLLVTVQEVVDNKEEPSCRRRCCRDQWMILDWIGTVVGAGLCLFFYLLQQGIVLLSAEMVNLQGKHPGLPPESNATATVVARYEDSVRTYEVGMAIIAEIIRAAVNLKGYHRIGMFLYTFFIMLRFFRGFLGQPVISSMTRTLEAACQDLIHLGFMLCITFENFVLGGMLLFGAEIEAWSSVNLAHQSALAMISGFADFSAMYNLYPISASVWLISFAITVIFLTSNMLLAIIVDHFKETNERLGQGSQNIVEQAIMLVGDVFWTGGFHLRNLIRATQEKVPKLAPLLPDLEDEPPRISRIPYEEIIEALEPACINEAADPLKSIRTLQNLSKEVEKEKNKRTSVVPLWAKGQPNWAPMQQDVLIACGCDTSTAERLLERAQYVTSGKKNDEFPSDILYHEFEGQMKNMYEQLAAIDEDLRQWLSERRVDCDNLEPRQRKFLYLANEKILPRPNEEQPMLMPSSPGADLSAGPSQQFALEGPNPNFSNMLGN